MRRFVVTMLSCMTLLAGTVSQAIEKEVVEASVPGLRSYNSYVKAQDIASNVVKIANFVADWTCAAVFIGEHDFDEYLKTDLDPILGIKTNLNPVSGMTVTPDYKKKTINVNIHGVDVSTSVYREGLGCANLYKGYSYGQLKKDRAALPVARTEEEKQQLWPSGERVDLSSLPPEIDRAALEGALDFAFTKPAEVEADPQTRAIVVVYKGKIVAERYGEGFNAQSLHYGASMSKSVTSALIGLRVKDGKLDLKKDHLLPEWQGATDPRSNINLDHLLRMSSGLEFKGTHNRLEDDGNQLLFMSPDMAGFAASLPLAAPIDSKFYYNCGTTNIISKVLRNSFEGDDQAYWNYPRKRLFDKLGMRHTLFQTDASGTFVGSSYVWASARDFARLGLLYVQNGRWNGEQLWPDGWVAYSSTPSTFASESTAFSPSA